MKFDPRIDKFALDEEWLNQPPFFHEYAEQLANAKRETEEAKNELELTKAELDLSIRKNPDAYDIPKITEKVVENVVIVQREVQEAQQKVIQAKHKEDLLGAAVRTLEQRKTALENEVKLALADYYSTPQADLEAMSHMERRAIRRRSARKPSSLNEENSKDG